MVSATSDRLYVRTLPLSIRQNPWLVALPFVALVILAPMFGAGLGPTDDHEIPMLQHMLVAGELPETDHGNGRFRPLYWVARVGEVGVWGQNANGWYLDRFLLVLASLAAGYALARVWLPTGIAALTSAAMILGPQSEAFARLGPQEAFAVPLTLLAFALIGRGKGWGVVLAVAAAFTKEPFMLSAALAVLWTWRQDRRWAVLGGLGVLLAGIGIVIALAQNGGTTQQASILGGVQLEGRYMFPFVLAAALGLGWLAFRVRPVVVVMLGLLAWGGVVAFTSATQRADETRAFQAVVAEIRADGRPVLVHVPVAGFIEYALALRRYLPGTPMQLDAPVSLPGFGPIGPDHLEITLP